MAIEAIQAQPEFPAQSEVRSSLSEQWRREIADRSPCSISDVFCLYIKTKSYHWHMRGPHFRDYHGLLDEQAHSSFGMTDEIAERAGKLGEATVYSIWRDCEWTPTRRRTGSEIDATTMLRELHQDNIA